MAFENRNIKPSQVLGHPIQTDHTKSGVYSKYMNVQSSQVNVNDISTNKAKIVEYKARMLNQKPELGFMSDKIASVKQNSFAGKETDKLHNQHNARLAEKSGNKTKIERQNLEVLKVVPKETSGLTLS